MSSGFWAGAVPPWAYATGGCLGILLVLLGMWAGYGRGWKHCKEDQAWAREQAKARRTHPVYRQPPELAHEWLGQEREDDPRDDALAHRGPGWPVNGAAVTTGEIQAITDEMDAWLAEHVYGAPADYGQWLEQQDR